jgi:hypothetical protein
MSPVCTDSAKWRLDLATPIGFIADIGAESLTKIHMEPLDVKKAISPRLNRDRCFSVPIVNPVSIYIMSSPSL